MFAVAEGGVDLIKEGMIRAVDLRRVASAMMLPYMVTNCVCPTASHLLLRSLLPGEMQPDLGNSLRIDRIVTFARP